MSDKMVADWSLQEKGQFVSGLVSKMLVADMVATGITEAPIKAMLDEMEGTERDGLSIFYKALMTGSCACHAGEVHLNISLSGLEDEMRRQMPELRQWIVKTPQWGKVDLMADLVRDTYDIALDRDLLLADVAHRLLERAFVDDAIRLNAMCDVGEVHHGTGRFDYGDLDV